MNLAISHRSMASGRLGDWNSGGTSMGSGSYPLARCIRVRFDDVGAVTESTCLRAPTDASNEFSHSR
jgi:hypothetical protein